MRERENTDIGDYEIERLKERDREIERIPNTNRSHEWTFRRVFLEATD